MMNQPGFQCAQSARIFPRYILDPSMTEGYFGCHFGQNSGAWWRTGELGATEDLQ